jgi:hypothetical protein
MIFSENMTQKIVFFISCLEQTHKNEIIYTCFDAKHFIVLYKILFI